MWVFLRLEHLNIVQFQVHVLVNRHQSSLDLKIVLELHNNLLSR